MKIKISEIKEYGTVLIADSGDEYWVCGDLIIEKGTELCGMNTFRFSDYNEDGTSKVGSMYDIVGIKRREK